MWIHHSIKNYCHRFLVKFLYNLAQLSLFSWFAFPKNGFLTATLPPFQRSGWMSRRAGCISQVLCQVDFFSLKEMTFRYCSYVVDNFLGLFFFCPLPILLRTHCTQDTPSFQLTTLFMPFKLCRSIDSTKKKKRINVSETGC